MRTAVFILTNIFPIWVRDFSATAELLVVIGVYDFHTDSFYAMQALTSHDEDVRPSLRPFVCLSNDANCA